MLCQCRMRQRPLFDFLQASGIFTPPTASGRFSTVDGSKEAPRIDGFSTLVIRHTSVIYGHRPDLSAMDDSQQAFGIYTMGGLPARLPLERHRHCGGRARSRKWARALSSCTVAIRIAPAKRSNVCSPEFLGKYRRLRGPADLAGLTLIYDLSLDRQIGFVTWDAWLETVGTKAITARSGLKINNSAAVLQAAIDGRGVALARSEIRGR
ncbi:hypothetical protein BN2476_490069 [Paraburkholderia piptadeniae]|uniref:Uncharacterized protein n=1 Tax=Paraburkholderia piptadeniae TaxID=1701573 RepID=A0A1N7SEX6_9BURK|nr:hypothetical protein BN2476_490069 [Paraburkholderia piptadeniae]